MYIYIYKHIRIPNISYYINIIILSFINVFLKFLGKKKSRRKTFIHFFWIVNYYCCAILYKVSLLRSLWIFLNLVKFHTCQVYFSNISNISHTCFESCQIFLDFTRFCWKYFDMLRWTLILQHPVIKASFFYFQVIYWIVFSKNKIYLSRFWIMSLENVWSAVDLYYCHF